ncbi:hypothetical protein MYX65_09295 [Acidobacteria bacterium AH-259-L09]|nr:hypothetical protein [Acidobacteria bacterium AH-259-L09]
MKRCKLVHRQVNFMPSAGNDQAQARRVGGGRMLATFTSTVKDLPVVLKIFQNLWVCAGKRGMLEVLSKPVSFCDKNRPGHNEV